MQERKENDTKICYDNFSHVRFAVMTEWRKEWKIEDEEHGDLGRVKNTCVPKCLYLRKLIKKIKKEMS